MKKLLSIILIGLTILACQQKEERADYVINGTAKDVYNGIRVYLNELNQRGQLVPVDTAIVMNEKFTFDGKVDYPKPYLLTMNGANGRIPLMIENAEMELFIDKKAFYNSVLTGSESHDLLNEFNKTLEKTKEDIKKTNNSYRSAQSLRDTIRMKSDRETLLKLNEKLINYPLEFVEAHSDSHTVLEILESQLRIRNVDFDKVNTLYDGLSASVKNNIKGIGLKTRIEAIAAQVKAEKATAIGATAPLFSAPSPNGNEIALTDVVKKGKITIVDFWAAWCGPCRRENPNVVRIYEKYHDKGLEIVGVSLDGRRGQRNPKEAWVKAIEDDKLPWNHVSNLNYFDAIANSYNVNAIPAMFVLDNKGTIIAKNLRGLALERKVAELLD